MPEGIVLNEEWARRLMEMWRYHVARNLTDPFPARGTMPRERRIVAGLVDGTEMTVQRPAEPAEGEEEDPTDWDSTGKTLDVYTDSVGGSHTWALRIGKFWYKFPSGGFWARITGHDGEGLYSWEEVVPDGVGGWTTPANGLTGEENAREVNESQANLENGNIVWMRQGPDVAESSSSSADETTWLFDKALGEVQDPVEID